MRFFQTLDKRQPEVSASTLRSLYGLLRQMFELAEQLDIIERSPVRPKLHKPEVAKVDKLKDEQMRLLTLLIAVTGMRLGEAMALRWIEPASNQSHALSRTMELK